MFKRIGVAVAALVVVLLAWHFLHKGGGGKITYETGDIDQGTVEKSISSSGSVAALVTVEIGSTISGQISELHVDFNSPVKKGDLLAVIDPQIYQQRVSSAEADLAVARATMASQQASLAKAETTLAQAKRDYDRSQQLAEQKLISQNDIETSRKAYELAQSDLVIAQAQIRNAEAGLQTRQSSLAQAQIDLSHTRITAPIDGVIISRSVDLGQTVAASFQAPVLFKIAQDLSQIQIEAKVDEADIGSIKTGDPATFTVDAFPDQTFSGQVAQVRLASTTVQNVVTYSVMVNAPNPRQMLLPGLTANVRIVTDHRENVVRVPNDATRFQPAGASNSNTGNAGGGFNGPPGGGPPNGGIMNDQVAKELGLSKEQQEKVRSALQAVFEQLRSQQQGSGPSALGGGGPGGPPFMQGAQQQAMRNRIENTLSSVLTPEQMEKFRQLRGQRGGAAPTARPGTLYTLEADGKPKAHQVMLGIADDRYTEVVEAGDLKPGDKVILRGRAEVKK